MVKNQFQIVYKTLTNNKVISLINLSGLVIGISSFILIILYVQQELTFDRFNENYNQIFKVSVAGGFNYIAPYAVVINDKVPEIEKVVRIDNFMGGGKSPIIKVVKDNQIRKIQVNDIIYADSTFFDVFSYKVIAGNAKEALTRQNSIVLTESTAHKIFRDENPVGKTVEYIGSNEFPKLNYTVTAVINDIPDNSSIKFNGIVSFNTLKSIKPGGVDVDEDFGNYTFETYVLMKKSCSETDLARNSNKVWLDDLSERYNIDINSKDVQESAASFIPLKDVNFYKNNKLSFIYLILLVGIIIIILAVINFINVSIAKASTRSREIGVKKIFGSSRYELIKQFIGETVAVTFIATVIAMTVVYFLLPVFNDITGKAITFSFFRNPKIVLLLISGSILVGIIAGIYPAFYLSAFKPIAILKNDKITGRKNSNITQFLIVFQFIISIALIASTILITRQVRQMRTGNIGFDNRNIITCQLTKSVKDKYDVFKHSLLQNPAIKSVSASSGEGLTEQFHMSFTQEINGSEEKYFGMVVDPDFIKTIGFSMVEGRDFSWDLESDKYKAVILNETAVKNFGLTDPIGFELEMLSDIKARVIGVVKDFHNESFRTTINSLALWYVPGYSYHLSIRIGGNDIPGTIQYIKREWEKLAPDIPFEFQFLDKKYDALYKDEEKLSLVIGYFSIIAILIACLGLFGLVTLIAESRTKEIGIRKVNGAKISEILVMLNKDFIKWVAIAFVIATPIAWYTMHRWLENFAYRTELSWWIFALAGLLVLVIALLTVSWQSWKAATKNPVEALRYE
jgi:putative ABC transport system permease protein